MLFDNIFRCTLLYRYKRWDDVARDIKKPVIRDFETDSQKQNSIKIKPTQTIDTHRQAGQGNYFLISCKLQVN